MKLGENIWFLLTNNVFVKLLVCARDFYRMQWQRFVDKIILQWRLNFFGIMLLLSLLTY